MIFDTDVLIWASRREAGAEALVLAEESRAASIITLMELLQGARSKAELNTTRGFFVALEIRILPVTEEISYAAAGLLESYSLSDGLNIQDALIAATARESGDVLVTANARHFRMVPNLLLKTFRPRA